MLQTSQYFFALLSAVCFSSSTLVFTEYSNRIGAVWMNCIKAAVAMCACFVTIELFYEWNHIEARSVYFFLFSGFFSLCLGDILLLKAFQRIGPGRTLVLFGFHPLTLGIACYFIFHQEISPHKFYAIFFLIGCLLTFTYEKFKEVGHWEFRGLLLAMAAVSMDAVGIVTTRLGFDLSPQIQPLEGHFYRCVGASLGFFILQFFYPFGFVKNFVSLKLKSRVLVVGAGFLGTFLSLWASFIALQKGHIATLTAVNITSPFLATVFESIYF